MKFQEMLDDIRGFLHDKDDMEFCFEKMWSSVYKDDVKSGIVKILYGYRVVGETEYTWVENSEINSIYSRW